MELSYSEHALETKARRNAAPGPPLWLTAAMYTILFLAGLYPVTVFGGEPYFPGPWESRDVIGCIS